MASEKNALRKPDGFGNSSIEDEEIRSGSTPDSNDPRILSVHVILLAVFR